MRVTWATDLHLNFVDDEGIDRFVREVRDDRPYAVLVGGDVGEAPSFAGYLQRLGDAIDLPIHFVLGNHDYYNGSISGVREIARTLSERSHLLNWLTESGPI